jgi:hypothetical protein
MDLPEHEQYFGGLLTRLETIQQGIERNGPDSHEDVDYPADKPHKLSWRQMRTSTFKELVRLYQEHKMDEDI